VTGQRGQRMVNMAVTARRGRLVSVDSDRPTSATNGQYDSDRAAWTTGQRGE